MGGMASLGLKLAAAVGSAGLAVLVLYPIYRARSAEKVIELRLGGDDGATLEAAREPRATGPAPVGPSVLDAQRPVFPPSAFVREPTRRADRFLTDEALGTTDPHVTYRHPPNLAQRREWDEHPDGHWMLVTNSLGLREDEEVLASRPDLRILIAGDSHTDGVCHNREAFGNLLEADLSSARPGSSIESLNAGKGGYDFYHYLGTLERFLDLEPDVFVVAVYGGNDFVNVLTPFHRFNGTRRPPGSALYADLMSEAIAREDLKPALAQSFASYKYFDTHPDQMEVALQAARDVTTEILVTCLRNSVHPVFVYIPAMPDTEWEQEADMFDALTEILEISPAGLASTDRMADSYLEFLRDRRVDVVDLREVFERAGPGNFWRTDHHINLRAQALIARELGPLVDAARPVGAERARRAPSSAGSTTAALLSPGSAFEALVESGETGESEVIAPWTGFDSARSVELFGQPAGTVPDAHSGYRYEANLTLPSTELGFRESFRFETNDHGFREDTDLAASADLRVVIAGDEQLVGGVANEHALGRIAADELRRRHPGSTVETLSAAVEGFGFHNYVGVLERSLELEPDVFVLVVSNGTDFLDVLRVDASIAGRRFARGLAKYEAALERVREGAPGALAHAIGSIQHFSQHDRASHAAVDLAVRATARLRDLCATHGIELVVVSVPDAVSVEWQRHDEHLGWAFEQLGLQPRHLKYNRRLGDAYAREIGRLGVSVLDAQDSLEEAESPTYSADELLLTREGHRRIGALLAEHLDSLGAFD